MESFVQSLGIAEQTWEAFKLFIERSSGITNDAVHILLGTFAFFVFAVLSRKPVSSFIPWVAVLFLELLNEWHDLRAEQWPSLAMQLGEGTKDIILTMAMPTLLLLLARYAPQIFEQPVPAVPAPIDEEEGEAVVERAEEA